MIGKAAVWNSSFYLRLTISLSILLLQLFQAECKCNFPNNWKGRWFQSGLGEVVIRDNVISQKGVCFEHHRDYFLLEKKDEGCFQCLLLIKRHKNIIQYKESFCIPRDSLRGVCNQIRIETPLYTLVREPSSPTRCPFQYAYYFNYNDQVSGFCDQPIAYAKPCVGQNKFEFHFKHCEEYAMWNGLDLDFDCLATWKDGSDMFMYGRFAGPGIVSKDESYRCFRYQYYGSDVYVSMSIDATCRGLRTARDGPFIMELTKDVFGWPPPSCHFPDWLTAREWRDVEGKHSYISDDRGEVISGFYRRRVNSKPHLQNEYKCVEELDYNVQKEEYVYLSFATHACLSKHQCIKIKRIAENVIEMYKGNMVDYESSNQCVRDEEYKDVQILILDELTPIDCPLPGLYQVQTSGSCIQHINVGCENTSTIELQSSCKDENDFSLECLAIWSGSTRTFFIVRQPHKDSRLVNCFSIKPEGKLSAFGTDRQCNRGISNLFNGAIKHSIAYKGNCKHENGHSTHVGDFKNSDSDSSIDSSEKFRQSAVSTTGIMDDYVAKDAATVATAKVSEHSQGQNKEGKIVSSERASSILSSGSNGELNSDNYNTVEGVKGGQTMSTGKSSSAPATPIWLSSIIVVFVLTAFR